MELLLSGMSLLLGSDWPQQIDKSHTHGLEFNTAEAIHGLDVQPEIEQSPKAEEGQLHERPTNIDVLELPVFKVIPYSSGLAQGIINSAVGFNP